MVATRGRSDSRTDSPPQFDQTLLRKNPIAAVSGENWAQSETPKTPLPSVAVNRRARPVQSAPTHLRKASPFTISAADFSFLIPKSVVLHDWWLIKAGGKKFGVGGFASRGRQGVKVFSSAAIAKRINTTTLETMDGITVTISGFINRSRTHQNGFPLEVCDHFLLGFPYDWEDYVDKCYNDESSSTGDPDVVELRMPSSGSSWNDFQQVSLDDLPVTRGRDLLMSATGDSETGVIKRSILDCILGKIPRKTVDSVVEEEPTTEHKTLPRGKRKCHTPRNASFMESNVVSPRTGVATRSMTRLIHLKQAEEEELRIRNTRNTSLRE